MRRRAASVITFMVAVTGAGLLRAITTIITTTTDAPGAIYPLLLRVSGDALLRPHLRLRRASGGDKSQLTYLPEGML